MRVVFMLRRSSRQLPQGDPRLHVRRHARALAELVELPHFGSPAARVGFRGHRSLRYCVFGLIRLDYLQADFSQPILFLGQLAFGRFVVLGVGPIFGQPHFRQRIDFVPQPELVLP